MSFRTIFSSLGQRPQATEQPKIAIRRSYVAAIENSVGSGQYRQLYMATNPNVEVLDDGKHSEAWYVSCILMGFKLIASPQWKTKELIKELEAAGWRTPTVGSLQPGTVMVWRSVAAALSTKEPLPETIGFYLGGNDKAAVSHCSKERSPQRHSWSFNSQRIPSLKLWHPSLD